MALLYALLAAAAALIAAAYRWKWPLIPALVCVGIVAYMSDEQSSTRASSFEPEQERESLSLNDLPPQFEVVRQRTLSNGATLITLRQNYDLLGDGKGGISPISVKGGCSIYHDPKTGISTALGC